MNGEIGRHTTTASGRFAPPRSPTVGIRGCASPDATRPKPRSEDVNTSQPRTAVQFLYRLFRRVLPVARAELQYWAERAADIPDAELRKQALASLKSKRFHADGGCVYAAVSLPHCQTLVRLIVALQTISDYLDNLCDRTGSYDGADFHQLHHAMRDAVQPGAALHDYYALRPGADDGGYLRELVETCRSQLAALPGFPASRPYIVWLVDRYCELQVHKHVDPALRERRLTQWWAPYAERFPDLLWWEFAAATGSTLGVFALCLSSVEPQTPAQAERLFELYFPWVGGLHILLDYLIDQGEDLREGDFNFVQCYPSAGRAHRRISWFVEQSLRRIDGASLGGRIHRDVVNGLLGMYLSDQKVRQQAAVRPAKRLLWQFGPIPIVYYGACRLYRFVR
ncbi:MAG: tetraprenyl-beta-curcumene synthase family protein [Alicyclobacillus sp.]|nr:tetraprenyl-beta-curcumene synthase family protein [Alicyclobacillus sp.]